LNVHSTTRKHVVEKLDDHQRVHRTDAEMIS